VCNQGSTLLSNLAIANVLGRVAFGEYAIVLSTVQAATALAGLGIGYTATRYIAEWRHRDPVRTGKLLGMFSRIAWITGFAALGLLSVASTNLANGILRAPALGTSLAIAAATALFMVRNSFLLGALAGFEAFRRIGMAGVSTGAVYLLATIGGARIQGVSGAAIGLLVSALAQSLILSWMLHKEKRAQSVPNLAAPFAEERNLLLRFAVPAALSGLTSVPVLWAIQALVARSPFGFEAVAGYAAGLNFLTVVLFVPTIVNSVAMPWINRRRALAGGAGFRNALRTNLLLTATITGAAVVLLALIGRPLLGLYGSDFRNDYAAVLVLLVAALPEALTIALNQSLQARERMWRALVGINLPRDLIILIAAGLLVPRYGALGAAGAYFVGRSVGLFMIAVMVRHDVVGAARTRI